MKSTPRFSYFWVIASIVASFYLSCRLFAPLWDTRLNSDNAIHILMAYDLTLPDDLYYWGQDRLGSLVPVVTHFLMRLLPLSPVVAISIVQHTLLGIAYLCFASLLTQPLSRVLLAIAFFLPLRLFQELTHIGQPYAAQFACLGLVTVGLRWLITQGTQAPSWHRRGMIGITVLSGTASLWVSDFSVVYLAVLLGAIAFHWWTRSPHPSRATPHPWTWVDPTLAASASLMGMGFLWFAKSSAVQSPSYTRFNSWAESLDLLTRMGQSILRNLSFSGQTPQLYPAAYAALALGSALLYLAWRYRSIIRQPSKQQLWLGSLSLAAGLSLIALLLSNWVYTPDALPQRYFIVVYGLVWVAALLFYEQLPPAPSRLLSGLFIAMAIANLYSLPLTPGQIGNDKLPRVVQLEALNPLAPAGFIGNYWQSYVLCSANPELFQCTPYDNTGKEGCPIGNGEPYEPKYTVGAVIRCDRCVNAVLQSPTIYLVKRNWLERFPDRIEQFGYCLERSGQSITVAKRRIAPYRRLGTHHENE